MPRRGLAVPLSVAGVAALLIAAAVAALLVAQRSMPRLVAREAPRLQSAQWSALTLFRRRAEEKLLAKDQEIKSIHAYLAQLERRRAALEEAMQATLLAMAEELRAQAAAEISLERVRLEARGMPQADIEKKLAGLQEALDEERSQRLARERERQQGTLDVNILALNEEIAEARRRLESAYRERRRMAEDTQRQADALLSQLRVAQGLLQDREREVEGTAEQLRRTAEEVRRAARQESATAVIVAGLSRALLDAIAEGDRSGAARAVAAFRAKLDEPDVLRAPVLGQLRASALQVTSFLSSYAQRMGGFSGSLHPELLEGVAVAKQDIDRLVTARESANAARAKVVLARALREAGLAAGEGGDTRAQEDRINAGLESLPEAWRGEVLLAIEELIALRSTPGEPGPGLLLGPEEPASGPARPLGAGQPQEEPAIGGAESEKESAAPAVATVDSRAIREQAYREALEAVSYLAGAGGSTTEGVRRTLLARTDEVPTYRELVQLLQLLAESGSSGRRIILERYEFIGFITAVVGERLTVDPLTTRDLAAGTRVAVRRRSQSGQVSEIAVGSIASASPMRIVISFDALPPDAESPRELDLVYALVKE